MIPWERLASAPTPNGGELRLMRRGGEVVIFLDRDELMSSRRAGSEEALATLGLAGLRPDARVLTAGLGLGFTLRATLGALGPGAAVTVAELVPAVVDWARGPLAELHSGSLDDPRVTVALGDVGPLIRAASGAYDAILIDVDNGPQAMVETANDELYGPAGLAAARRALSGGGRLAIWSARPDPGFTKRLARSGFRVDERAVRAGGLRGGPKHVVWVATRT